MNNSPYKKTILDNGLRVITYNMPNMQSAALGIWIKVGGRYESAANKGISHYLEHLLFKGSREYSCQEVKEAVEGVGGSLNGFTSEETTCYLAKLPYRHLERILAVLSDMVLHPLLQAEDIEKERTVILEEIKMYKDLPQYYVHDLLDELLWPSQPLGLPVIGLADSVKQIRREDLITFKKNYYVAPNIVISIAGLLNHDKLLRRIKQIFLGLKEKNTSSFSKAKQVQSKAQLKLLPKDTEQTHLALGFHSLKREHPLKHALGLLHVILGANMSSRLFQEIREKRGLAYEIGTQVKRFYDTGAFIVHAGIDNLKVEQALKLILAELKKVKFKLVEEDELRRAKEFYLGQLTLALEDTLDHMLWIGEPTLILDKTYTLDQITRDVVRLTRKDVLAVAAGIFKEQNLNLALIGPLEDKKENICSNLRFD